MRVNEYVIYLDVNSRDHSFRGTEKIHFNCENEKLRLHSAGLEISHLRIGGNEAGFAVDEGEQTITVDQVLTGNHTAEIGYSGKISDSLMGLYRARSNSGEVFTTQFAPSDARRVFPCIDEPAFKAEFCLTLKIDRDLDAISNMPVKNEKEEDGKRVIEFEKTPRMSTYLLYIGIGKFDYMEGKYGDKQITLAAAKGRISKTDYPIEIAAKSLAYYEEYFGIKYALPKVHLISVPEFALGAMENWGAITFREILLTVSRNTGASTLKSVAGVIAHELAHQWFGNLVTMKWWNDLWLNESFATFMSSKVIHSVNPEWDVWGDFLLSETQRAMRGDSLMGSHPIDVKVKDTSEIAQIFDEISYGKGGSILRMIESYVGEENFRNGIRKYLNMYSYGNATGEDLWKSIEEISRQPVSRIMGAWITKQGFPVVRASRSGNRIVLTQGQFYLSGKTGQEIWPVPLTVVRSGRVESVLFDSRETEIESAGFIKLNSNQTGFYRTLYDRELYSAMMKALPEISNLERWGIVNDLYNFALSGHISLDEYLDRMQSFMGETDYIVAEEISSQLLDLCLAMPENRKLVDFAVKFMKRQLEGLGEKREGEHPNMSILRGSVALRLSIIDRKYSAEISGRFAAYDEEDPDMKQAIATSYAISANSFEGLAEKLSGSESDEDRVRIISAMGWLQDGKQLGKAMEMIKAGRIKKQDTSRFYISASANPESKPFMLENLEFAVRELYSSFAGMGMTGRIVERLIPGLGTHDREKLVTTLDRLHIDEIERGKSKGIELMDIILEFRNRSVSN